jgi:hypothetical protein
MKRTILAVVAVFVAWSVLDFILHGMILRSTYEATASLWRPMEEFKWGLNYVVVLISAACFVFIYDRLIAERSMNTALLYGLVFGIGAGVSMGYGSYTVMPIPYYLALAWFLGTVVLAVVGGWVAWLIVGRGGRPSSS